VDFSPEDIATVQTVWSYTVTSPERIFALIRSAEYVVENSISGDIVECGVWRGGSMMVVARTLVSLRRDDRILWLYDTFAGMTAPGEDDVGFDGEAARTEFDRRRTGEGSSTWAAAALDEVRENLSSTGYPQEMLRFIEGPVEQTIPRELPDAISILRLDTDWYSSTRHELEHLYPRLVPGGVLIIDDYGHWRGSRKATDEYFAQAGARPLLNRIDYSARIMVKS
jgi:hypothetical protein